MELLFGTTEVSFDWRHQKILTMGSFSGSGIDFSRVLTIRLLVISYSNLWLYGAVP